MLVRCLAQRCVATNKLWFSPYFVCLPDWFQRLTFSWVDRLLSRGRKNSLVERFEFASLFYCPIFNSVNFLFFFFFVLFCCSDLQLPAELRCQLQCEGFTANWEAEQKSDSPSLARALWKTYSREIIAVGFIKAIWGAVLIFTAFYLVRSLVAFMGDKTKSDDVGYGFSIGFFFACLAMSICLQQLNHHATMTGSFPFCFESMLKIAHDSTFLVFELAQAFVFAALCRLPFTPKPFEPRTWLSTRLR
jgi:hypothetical protein